MWLQEARDAGKFEEAESLQKIADEASETAAREREESRVATANAAREKAEADEAAAYNSLYTKYPRALLCGKKYGWTAAKCIEFGGLIEADAADKGYTDAAEQADAALQFVISAIKEEAKLEMFMERKRDWGVRTMMKRMMANLKTGFLGSALMSWRTNMTSSMLFGAQGAVLENLQVLLVKTCKEENAEAIRKVLQLAHSELSELQMAVVTCPTNTKADIAKKAALGQHIVSLNSAIDTAQSHLKKLASDC